MQAPVSSSNDIQPGSIAAWVVAIRPKTLPAAVAPVLVGAALAHRVGGFELVPALFAMAGALLLQMVSNLANDLFDFEKGKDTAERVGPVRAVQSGLLSAAQVRMGLGCLLLGCLVVGSYLVGRSGWPLVVIGIASMLAALAYTAGPYPLGYHGLGDLFVFVFFGPVAVVGTEFAVSGTTSAGAYWASISIGALTTNILVVNNLRDRAEDTRTGKRTAAVRFGERFCVAQAKAMVSLAYLAPLYFLVAQDQIWPLLLPALTLPLALRWLGLLDLLRGRALNAQLAGAARLLLAFAMLFALALWSSP
jgi:1,4-dihydroxy-2-naphthoate polyprenyltransferase